MKHYVFRFSVLVVRFYDTGNAKPTVSAYDDTRIAPLRVTHAPGRAPSHDLGRRFAAAAPDVTGMIASALAGLGTRWGVYGDVPLARRVHPIAIIIEHVVHWNVLPVHRPVKAMPFRCVHGRTHWSRQLRMRVQAQAFTTDRIMRRTRRPWYLRTNVPERRILARSSPDSFVQGAFRACRCRDCGKAHAGLPCRFGSSAIFSCMIHDPDSGSRMCDSNRNQRYNRFEIPFESCHGRSRPSRCSRAQSHLP
jgi:hypothetical protein